MIGMRLRPRSVRLYSVCLHTGSETLYACNTYQFNDYSRYDFNLFSEENKRHYRDEHFAIDLQNAYDLGQRLVAMAQD